MRKKFLLVFGTRPEAIKLAPIYRELKASANNYEVRVCSTGQHKEMLEQVTNFFDIKIDYDLKVMKPNQSLFRLTSEIIKKIEYVFDDFEPDLVFVQGDTTTAFCGSLASFYKKVPVAHIEAGLRSFDKYSPFPEEVNRLLVGHLADYHFAPTKKAKENLIREGIKKNVWIVGNTVIDALFLGLKIIDENKRLKNQIEKYFSFIDNSKKVLLLTVHRRESFGEKIDNVLNAIKEVAVNRNDIQIVFPVHLNPNVRDKALTILKKIGNVKLIEPLSYPYLIYLMRKSKLVVTDSGGIQEEAPSLKKPVVVLRDVTERMEGVLAKNAILVGTDKHKIIDIVNKLLDDDNLYNSMTAQKNPYGDGRATKRIIKKMEEISAR